MISTRPLPTWELPSQAWAAPTPLSGPLYTSFVAVSFFRNGFQRLKLCRLSMCGNIVAGGALMLIERDVAKVSGLVDA